MLGESGQYGQVGNNSNTLINYAPTYVVDGDDTTTHLSLGSVYNYQCHPGEDSCALGTESYSSGAVPPVVAIESSPHINAGNQSGYTLSGTCNLNNRIVSVKIHTLPAENVGCYDGTWTLTSEIGHLPDGLGLQIRVEHLSATGELASDTATVDKYTTPPVLMITSLLIANQKNVESYRFQGICSEEGVDVAVAIQNREVATVSCSGGNWQYDPDAANLDDGSYPFTITHADSYVTGEVSGVLVVDTISPTLTIEGPSDINLHNQDSYSVSGECSEREQIVTVIVGNQVANPHATCDGTHWSLAPQIFSGLDNGENITILATHIDAQGNTGSATATITKELTPPVVAITSYDATIHRGNEGAYQMGGTCNEEGREVAIAMEGIETATGSGTCASSLWTATMDATGLSEYGLGGVRSATITAYQRDAHGNRGEDSRSVQVDLPRQVLPLSRISVGSHQTVCAASTGGKMRCWGTTPRNLISNIDDDLLRRPDNANYPIPPLVRDDSSGKVIQVAVGRAHACALGTGGRIYCMGSPSYYQLGSWGSHLTMYELRTFLIGSNYDNRAPLEDIVQISAGEYHTCALTEEGKVLCWGSSSRGPVGQPGYFLLSSGSSRPGLRLLHRR